MESRSEEILFSILVPVRNTVAYLRQCIDSILAQNYHNYEVIIVDNDSSDGSEKILDEYALAHANMTVIHQENMGLLMSRRVAISCAKGEYLCFVDSDDYIAPDFLSKIYHCIKKSAADVIVFGYQLVDENGKKLNSDLKLTLKENYRQDEIYEFVLKMAEEPILNNLWLKAVKRELFDLRKNEEYKSLGHINGVEGFIQTLEILSSAVGISTNSDAKIYFYRIRNTSTVRSIDVWGRIDEYAYSNQKLNEYFSSYPQETYRKYRLVHFPVEVFSVFGIIRSVFQQNITLKEKRDEMSGISDNAWVKTVLERVGVPHNRREFVLWCAKHKLYVAANIIFRVTGG